MEVQENGNGIVGGKNKYKRMDSDASEEVIVMSIIIKIKRVFLLKKRIQRYMFLLVQSLSLSILCFWDMFSWRKNIRCRSQVDDSLCNNCFSVRSCFNGSCSFTILMIGRLLAGVGIGFGLMIAPVYITETSPAAIRGSLTSFPEIFINLGILLGYISNYVFSGLQVHINWRVMLGVGILPSIFMGVALFVIPESPRWLVMHKRIEEARVVLSKTNETEREVGERLAEIQLAAGLATSEKHEAKAV